MTVSLNDHDIPWTDDFLIGITELDYEHRRLLEDINKLHKELLEQADITQVKETLGSIHARLQAHFALEEMVMSDKHYVDFDEHKREHDHLLNEYTERMINYEKDPTLQNRETMERTLREWMVNHILKNDKQMSRMIEQSA